MIFVFSEKISKNEFFSLKFQPDFHNYPQKWYQLVGNFILFHMTSSLLKFDVSIAFYLSNIKFSKFGGHLGGHLGFGGFRNKFFEVDLWNIICYNSNLKISMVYLVCREGATHSKNKRVLGVWPSAYKDQRHLHNMKNNIKFNIKQCLNTNSMYEYWTICSLNNIFEH